jgi:hypothetical protein
MEETQYRAFHMADRICGGCDRQRLFGDNEEKVLSHDRRRRSISEN